MPTLALYLDGLILKKGTDYKGLYVFPVCVAAPGGEDKNFLTLNDGMKNGQISIFETGDMERVRIKNRSSSTAVALDGETLLGGAQNRMLNAGCVISSGSEEELTSSCIEVKRWDCKKSADGDFSLPNRSFGGSDAVFGSLKRIKTAEMIRSLTLHRSAKVDKTTVWRHIIEIFGICEARTKTLDMHDLYDYWDGPLRVFSSRFTSLPSQVGIVSFTGRSDWFIDLFADNELFHKNFKKLIRAYSFDCLIRIEKELPPPSKPPSLKDAQSVFNSLKLARINPFPQNISGAKSAVNNKSESEEPQSDRKSFAFFVSTPSYAGSGLIHSDSLIHLTSCSIM